MLCRWSLLRPLLGLKPTTKGEKKGTSSRSEAEEVTERSESGWRSGVVRGFEKLGVQKGFLRAAFHE
jgi:hypothetical protein